MEKYLADRSYALIYRMCQVQAFSSRLHARGFPAIGKYGPKTPPRMAGVTKCVIGFADIPGSPGVSARQGRSAQPRNRSHEPSSLPGSARPSRTRGRSALSPAAFPVLSPEGAVRLRMDNTMPGEFVSLRLSRFSARCRNCSPPGAFRSPGSETERCGPEDRCVRMSDRPGMPAPVRSGNRPARTASSEASYSVRTDTAIICFVMWRAYPSRSCDISQPRLEAHRPCLRPFPATRSLPTEGGSRAQAGSIGNAKAGTSGHMIRDGDGLRVVSEISVRFPFSARRGRPLRAA